MKKRLFFISMFAALILGGLFALKFYQLQKTVNQFQPPPPAIVAVTEVKPVNWQSSLTAVGELAAVSSVEVTNEISGIVKSIHFDSGQKVDKGQLLVKLDSTTDQAELGGLLADRRLAKIEHDRSKKLINRKFISNSIHDQNQALLEKANAIVLTKQSIIAKKHILAPFSGQLGIRNVDLGQYLTPGSSIVILQQLNPIYIDFKLPERYLSSLVQGQEINVSVQAYPNKAFKGRVSAISPLIDKNTRSVQMRATLSNTDHLLHPGMFAHVRVLSGITREVLTLPNTAISYNPYGDCVFVVDSGKQGLTVQSRQVETGVTREGRVEIIKGLSLGEKVVSAGQIKLRNGMAVLADENPSPSERIRKKS